MSFNLEQALGGNFVLSKAGLGIGSTTSQLATTATVNYTLDGVFQTAKTATTTIALTTPTNFVLTNIPAGSKSNFGLWLDSAGAFTVTQGAVSIVNAATEKAGPPANPGGRVLVGVASVYNGSASAFVPATTAFNAASITTTYFDMSLLPAGGF